MIHLTAGGSSLTVRCGALTVAGMDERHQRRWQVGAAPVVQQVPGHRVGHDPSPGADGAGELTSHRGGDRGAVEQTGVLGLAAQGGQVDDQLTLREGHRRLQRPTRTCTVVAVAAVAATATVVGPRPIAVVGVLGHVGVVTGVVGVRGGAAGGPAQDQSLQDVGPTRPDAGVGVTGAGRGGAAAFGLQQLGLAGQLGVDRIHARGVVTVDEDPHAVAVLAHAHVAGGLGGGAPVGVAVGVDRADRGPHVTRNWLVVWRRAAAATRSWIAASLSSRDRGGPRRPRRIRAGEVGWGVGSSTTLRVSKIRTRMWASLISPAARSWWERRTARRAGGRRRCHGGRPRGRPGPRPAAPRPGAARPGTCPRAGTEAPTTVWRRAARNALNRSMQRSWVIESPTTPRPGWSGTPRRRGRPRRSRAAPGC